MQRKRRVDQPEVEAVWADQFHAARPELGAEAGGVGGVDQLLDSLGVDVHTGNVVFLGVGELEQPAAADRVIEDRKPRVIAARPGTGEGRGRQTPQEGRQRVRCEELAQVGAAGAGEPGERPGTGGGFAAAFERAQGIEPGHGRIVSRYTPFGGLASGGVFHVRAVGRYKLLEFAGEARSATGTQSG